MPLQVYPFFIKKPVFGLLLFSYVFIKVYDA